LPPRETPPAMPTADKVYTLKDVSSHDFVVEYAQHLKKTGKMEVPKWVDLAKTGPFKELAPYDEDFYYIRAGEPPLPTLRPAAAASCCTVGGRRVSRTTVTKHQRRDALSRAARVPAAAQPPASEG
jgi:ribosomal protein S19E (S16A)